MPVRSEMTRQRVRAAWLFLTPMLVVLAVVAGWPLLRTIWFSFTDANLSALDAARFVGLENYLARYDGEWAGLLADGDWWLAVYNTLWFAVVSVSLETVLGMIVALVLHSGFRGRGLVRAAVLIPWAIPTVVSARMWSWMLHDQFGVINSLLHGRRPDRRTDRLDREPADRDVGGGHGRRLEDHALHGAAAPGRPADGAAATATRRRGSTASGRCARVLQDHAAADPAGADGRDRVPQPWTRCASSTSSTC